MEPDTWDGCIGGGWGLLKMERHCLCKVVFGRDKAGRRREGAPVHTARMSRGEASGVCSSGGKFVVYPECEKMEKASPICC